MCAKFQFQKIHPQNVTSNLSTCVVARDNFTIANFTMGNFLRIENLWFCHEIFNTRSAIC